MWYDNITVNGCKPGTDYVIDETNGIILLIDPAADKDVSVAYICRRGAKPEPPTPAPMNRAQRRKLRRRG